MEKIRLQKYFTDCGVMSRRRAEKEIADGNVKVNGEVAVVGQTVIQDVDTVEYNGKIIRKCNEADINIMLKNDLNFIVNK